MTWNLISHCCWITPLHFSKAARGYFEFPHCHISASISASSLIPQPFTSLQLSLFFSFFFLAPLAVVFDTFSSLWFCCFLHPSSVLSQPQLCGGQLHYKTTEGNGLLRGRAVERERGRGKETAEISRATVMKCSCLHLICLLLAFA